MECDIKSSKAKIQFISIQKKITALSQSSVLMFSSVYEMYILIINVTHEESLHWNIPKEG